MGVFAALIASLAWGVGDFLGGTLSRRMSAFAVAGASQLFGIAVVLVAVAVATPAAPSWAVVGFAGVSGVMALLGAVFMYRAMAIGRMGVVAPIVGSCAVVPLAWGLLRGEQLTTFQGVGIAACFGGIILVTVSVREPPKAGARPWWQPVLLALASAFSFGIGIVLLATASLDSPVYSTLFLRISSAITAGVVLLARRTKARFSGIDVGIVGVLGVVDAVGYLGFTYAAATGQIALAAVLSGLYPVVTAVLAFFVHKERLTLAQILGVAVTLAGVVLISL